MHRDQLHFLVVHRANLSIYGVENLKCINQVFFFFPTLLIWWALMVLLVSTDAVKKNCHSFFLFSVEYYRSFFTNLPCNFLMRWPDGVCQFYGWNFSHIWWSSQTSTSNSSSCLSSCQHKVIPHPLTFIYFPEKASYRDRGWCSHMVLPWHSPTKLALSTTTKLPWLEPRVVVAWCLSDVHLRLPMDWVPFLPNPVRACHPWCIWVWVMGSDMWIFWLDHLSLHIFLYQ